MHGSITWAGICFNKAVQREVHINLIIIPVLCGRAMTKRCIESALAQDIDTHVLVIDNGSTDGTAQYLRSLPIKRVTLITNLEPLGLNEVWNNALDIAFDSLHLEHALVINNDTVLMPHTYRLLRDDGGLFVTGVSVDKMEQTEHADVTSKSPHPSFSCFLIREYVWRRVGRFDERFYAWASDGDYHLRMDKLGIDAYALDVPFYHQVSGTLKQTLLEDRDFHNELCARSDADREKFKAKWGFGIGSVEYYDQFRVTRDKKYQETGRL